MKLQSQKIRKFEKIWENGKLIQAGKTSAGIVLYEEKRLLHEKKYIFVLGDLWPKQHAKIGSSLDLFMQFS